MSTLYRRGRILTPAAAGATALLVDGATVSWVGADADAPGASRTVDLDGALVTPAFVDAHVHVTDTGLALDGLDLRPARSLREALDAVERAARRGRGRPILGGGWDETTWPEQRPPTSAELDRASYGGLVYLARVDIHSAVVSSSLLASVPGLAGGGPADGVRGQGWIGEPAHDRVRTAALRALGAGQRRDAQRSALRAAAALGIACVHEMAGPVISGADDLLALLAPGDDEDLPRVVGYWGELGAIDAAHELGAVGAAGDLFCDGSLGSNTAALRSPYADRPDTAGLLRHDTAELVEHIVACAEAGLQSGFHAIGDAAVDQVLDAYELASGRLGRPAGAGQRIEHAEYVQDPARLAASGLTASMQPCFDELWGGTSGLYSTRLGAERALALNRCGELAAAGVPLAFGSDTPVTALGPWAAIRAAAHHHDPTASLDPLAAFDAHTRAA
ncbi:amidohydrolase, partial [Jatrophihabitans endophyticus]|uniref:amidohydrolase n=1 Tax=Jatrophihabitans endophyticus TaxID=1206085 RepID=UPI0019DE1C13